MTKVKLNKKGRGGEDMNRGAQEAETCPGFLEGQPPPSLCPPAAGVICPSWHRAASGREGSTSKLCKVRGQQLERFLGDFSHCTWVGMVGTMKEGISNLCEQC